MSPENSMSRPPFDDRDFDLLLAVVRAHPAVEAVAAIVKRVRAARPTYPLNQPDDLAHLLDENESLMFGDYIINRQGIYRRVVHEWFPLRDERSLIRAIILALAACREDGLRRSGDTPADTPTIANWISYDEHGAEVSRGE